MGEVQTIRTDSEELVVLSRRDYDALRARAGDEAAEDLMTARIVADTRGRTTLPAEVLDRILDGANAVAVLAEHRGLSMVELARRTGLDERSIAELMRSKAAPGGETLARLCAALDVSADVLEA